MTAPSNHRIIITAPGCKPLCYKVIGVRRTITGLPAITLEAGERLPLGDCEAEYVTPYISISGTFHVVSYAATPAAYWQMSGIFLSTTPDRDDRAT